MRWGLRGRWVQGGFLLSYLFVLRSIFYIIPRNFLISIFFLFPLTYFLLYDALYRFSHSTRESVFSFETIFRELLYSRYAGDQWYQRDDPAWSASVYWVCLYVWSKNSLPPFSYQYRALRSIWHRSSQILPKILTLAKSCHFFDKKWQTLYISKKYFTWCATPQRTQREKI